MRFLHLTVVLCAAFIAPAFSQSIKLYDGPAKIDLMGTAVDLPLVVNAVPPKPPETTLSLQARAGLDAALPVVGRKLTEAIAANNKGCTERWSAWNGTAAADGGEIKIRATVRLEKWLCSKLVKTRLARETGTIHAGVTPSIRGEGLRLDLTSFRVDDLSALSTAFGLENIARQEVLKLLREVNENPDLKRPPPELTGAGFRYRSIAVRKMPDGSSQLHASVVGPGDLATLLKLVAGFAR